MMLYTQDTLKMQYMLREAFPGKANENKVQPQPPEKIILLPEGASLVSKQRPHLEDVLHNSDDVVSFNSLVDLSPSSHSH